jgi:hypothetical protein
MKPSKQNLPRRHAGSSCCFLARIVFCIALSAQLLFNSIPPPLPGNVSSLGPEAYAFSQLGDGLVFTSGSP